MCDADSRFEAFSKTICLLFITTVVFLWLTSTKNLFWKIHCAPNKTIQEKYSLQSLCTINQKDNSPSLTHIILPLQTSFMSSPPRADIQLANLIVREGPTKLVNFLFRVFILLDISNHNSS